MTEEEAETTQGAPDLAAFVHRELAREQPAPIHTAAGAARAGFGDHALAVLFYGSCLRSGRIDDRIIDFYLIVDDYRAAYRSRLLAIANRILPPNVFYNETSFDGTPVRAKTAVLSLQDFIGRCGPGGVNASVWARFSQPVALVYSANDVVRRSIEGAVAEAIKTMICAALPLVPDVAGPREVWSRAFDLTYSAEFRSEGRDKGEELYELDRDRYDAITPLVFAALEGAPSVTARAARRRWFWRRLNGKAVSFLRLVKAAFTFEGGVDYLAWKISRHSGVEIEIKPWQRRHPILAGLVLFLRLRLKGAFR